MKVLILCQEDFVPPRVKKSSQVVENSHWRTEYYVREALKKSGHTVDVCGISNNLEPLRSKLKKFKPHVVFNLLEEFSGEGLLEHIAVSYLHLIRQPYTGNSDIPLILAKNKLAAKKIFHEQGLRTPLDQRFPKIVKLSNEESSRGLSEKSIVKNHQEARTQIARMQLKYNCAAFTEEYIEGRELHVAVLRINADWLVAPVWETIFGRHSGHKILSEKLKWNFAYRDRVGVKLQPAQNIPPQLLARIQNVAIRSCRSLGVDGYARVDMRLTPKGEVYVLEVNPNPDIAQGDEFAECMRTSGYEYGPLLDILLRQASSRFSKNRMKV